jgi:putative ABC transport system substrate-binding protein
MKRRDFIALIGAAAAWPLAARAQQPSLPVIGFLNGQSPSAFAHLLTAFRRGLNETGFVEGQNVAIEFRWAHGRADRLPELAADLLRQNVKVIAVGGGVQGALAAKAATSTVPIVTTSGSDPVRLGLVASLNRPGGNVTAVSIFSTTLEAKRLELLKELVPGAPVFGVLLDPTFAGAQVQRAELEAAARTLNLPIHILAASIESEIEAAFAQLAQSGMRALSAVGNPFFNSKRDRLISLAARHAIPTMFELREFAQSGGLMAYGPSITDVYRQIGVYTGRILKGATPAELPVLQPSKFELVINLKTARSLGLEIPATLLARADEVIE